MLPVTDVPLPDVPLALPVRPVHPRTLARIAEEHQLGTPVNRLTTALATRAS